MKGAIRTAVILAAGRGSRLGPVTDDVPKALIHVGGRRLIEWQLQSLRAGGIEEVVVVGGYRAELLRPYADHLVVSRNWQSSTMVGSLRLAIDEVQLPVLVSYADVIYDQSLVRGILDSSGMSVGYLHDWLPNWRARYEDPAEDAETFEINEAGRVLDIGRSMHSGDVADGQFAGVYSVTREAWELAVLLEDSGVVNISRLSSTDLIRLCIEHGIEVAGIPAKGPWFEIDTLRDLTYAQSKFVGLGPEAEP